MNKVPLLTPRLEQALELAIRVHGSMKRKGDGRPYLVHPMSVLGLLVRWDADEDTCIAGLLHDVIEDAEDDSRRAEYRKEIEEKFGKEVLEIVEGVTEQDKSLPWKERKKLYLKHLKEGAEESLLVSCADQTHNLASLVEAYTRKGEEVWKRFNAIKQWKVWFIDQVGDIFKERLAGKYAEEFLKHLKELNALISKPVPEEYQSFGRFREDVNTLQIIMDPLYQELWDHCMLTEEEMESGVLEVSAKRDDAVEQYLAGLSHFNDKGLKKDIAKAMGLFRNSAERGLPCAQFALGSLHYSEYARDWAGKEISRYIPVDDQKALAFFRSAAANGHVLAQMMLAEWYEEGIVVEKDEALSKAYRKSANEMGQYGPVKNGDLLPKPPTQDEIDRYRACSAIPPEKPIDSSHLFIDGETAGKNRIGQGKAAKTRAANAGGKEVSAGTE